MKNKLFPIAVMLILVCSTPYLFAQTPEKIPATITQKTASQVKKTPVPATKKLLRKKTWQTPTAARTTFRQQDTVKNTDPTLNGQYQFLLSRSKNINGYKLMNPYRLTSVWTSVLDTLKKERSALATANAKIAEQQKTISSLKTEVTGKEEKISENTEVADEIDILGMPFKKGTYSIIVWSIILVLAIALIVVIARSAKNIMEAKHRTQLYDEISAEYQTFKSKANEKERKLARELQDERNKLDELNNKN